MIPLFLIYLLGAILCYAHSFAYFQHKYEYLDSKAFYGEDRRFSLVLGVSSWVGLGIMLIVSKGKYGLKFK